MVIMINKLLFPPLFFLCYLIHFPQNYAKKFDVRQHLCTVTRYDAAKRLVQNEIASSTSIPNGFTPIHLNLVSRHGTRTPTKEHLKEFDVLARDLKILVNDAKQEAEKRNSSVEKIPDWLQGWKSPWKGAKEGELIVEGEIELANLGINVRKRFRKLFNQRYDPSVFTIKSTNISRVLDSAKAFSRGLFSGQNRHHFAVITESRDSDVLLRFFDQCETYKQYRNSKQPLIEKLQEPIFGEITSALVNRYPLNFTRQEVASLWFLCKQEASLLDITDQACSLFTPSEVLLMEWADDIEVYLLRAYGNSINYLMGVPLLQDVVHSMEKAIRANEENSDPGTYEKAALRFAHAETVIPFSCLLGLFLRGQDLERLKQELPLKPPPKPPQKRNWRGTLVAPFAGNIMLVLYHCPSNTTNKYYVQVLHNEVPVPMPGCGNSVFCPFETFMDKIVNPHLEHYYNSICTGKLTELEPNYKFCCLASPFQCEASPSPSLSNRKVMVTMPTSKSTNGEEAEHPSEF